MASRAGSAPEGEVFDDRKHSNISQTGGCGINGSDRVFGMDGTSDTRDYPYRPLSRSPSPYRARRARSPSPYHRKRNVDRSPSPYHRKRNVDRSPSSYHRKRNVDRSPSPYRRQRDKSRSPSPFRHGRNQRGNEDNSRSHFNKRKLSPPPRTGRPDKRHHTDRNRYNDRPRNLHHHDARATPLQPSPAHDRRQLKPISYADNEHPAPVPNFTEPLSATAQGDQCRANGSEQNGRSKIQPDGGVSNKPANETKDATMTSSQDEPEYTLEPTAKEAPTESREEKRRRWAAIRAAAEKEKPKENLLQQALLTTASESTTPNITSPAPPMENSVSPAASPSVGTFDSGPASPDFINIDKQTAFSEANSPAADSPSAADYDPTKDMLDDRDRAAKKVQQPEMSSDAYNETDPKVLSTLPDEKAVPAKKKKKEFDMFDFDNSDDSEDSEDQNTAAKGHVLDVKLLDNWDDPEGYYKIISNELVNAGRYRMIKSLGRGVFANVAQAEDVKDTSGDQSRKLVAIKMIRKNDLMRKASQKEMDFLRKVNEADPQDKRHIIRLLGSFDHKGHLCIVFEHMSKNLRDLLKEETNGHGLSLQAVRTYARQMFSGLQHLQNCLLIHLDLKPDNVLVSPDRKNVKLCDFGTAVDHRDIIERTEYLVSRFYRAPEIILGMDIGYGVDMWAIGCTVYELWTGKILFTGRSNNQMVKSFMDCLGWPSEKLLKKGLYNNVMAHFETGPPLKFISREVDQFNHPFTRKIEQQKKVKRDLKTRVHEATRGMGQGAPTVTELNDFVGLLSACLNLNVEKRISPKDALSHKFFAIKQNLAPRPPVLKPPMVKRGVSGLRR